MSFFCERIQSEIEKMTDFDLRVIAEILLEIYELHLNRLPRE